MSLIREVPPNERPREKALRYGIESLSNRELLALLLRTGIPGKSVFEVADELLDRANGIGGLAKLDQGDLCAVPGISTVKSLELQASIELSKRISYSEALEHDAIKEPETIVRWLKQTIGVKRQEHFLVIFLDNANHIISSRVLFVGTINSSIVSPREIIREALIQSAVRLVLVHNHPSGNLEPSREDIAITKKIMEAAKLVDIEVLDHLIVSHNQFLSMGERGYFGRIILNFDEGIV